MFYVLHLPTSTHCFFFSPFCLQHAFFIFLPLWDCYLIKYSDGDSALMEVVLGTSVSPSTGCGEGNLESIRI